MKTAGERICVTGEDVCKDFCKKSMHYSFGEAGATALIIPYDLSIPSNCDICSQSAQQKYYLIYAQPP